MADKIIIELDLEKGDIKTPFKDVEKQARKTGKDSGKKFKNTFRDNAKNVGANLFGGLRSKLVALTGLAAGLATALVFKESISAAIAQEDAVNRLNGALKSAGSFSESASQELQDYAAELQKTTKFGDETILNQLALAKSFGASNQQAKEVAAAATDLSAALGIDLESATRNVAKTLGGYAGELGETIPALKNLTQEQLRAGEGIALLQKQFAGQAQNAVQTFSGRLAQARNTFGDLLETIGSFITQNPFVLKALSSLNTLFLKGIKVVKGFFAELDTFKDIIEPILNFNDAIIEFVIAPLELVANVGKFVFRAVVGGIQTAIAALGQLGGAIASVLEGVGLGNELTEGLKVFADSSKEVARDAALETRAAFDNILDFSISAKLQEKNQELREGFTLFNEELKAQSEVSKQELDQFSQFAQQNTGITTNALKKTAEAAKTAAQEAAEAAKKLLKDANRVINQGLARTISGGIQNIANSLATGKDVFAEFGNFLLSAFGDLAIQLGEFYIATGLANLALLSANPAAQIATGAALVAVGSIIKSFFAGGVGGSGGSGAASGAGANATNAGESGFDQTDLTDDPAAIERQEPNTQVSINIQGDVLDSDETGTRIAKTLSDAFGKQGITLSDARFS